MNKTLIRLSDYDINVEKQYNKINTTSIGNIAYIALNIKELLKKELGEC